MNSFIQIVLIIGRITSQGIVNMLGTGFIISQRGLIATTAHNININDKNLVIIRPNINSIESYQDTTNLKCNTISVKLKEIDPIRDIAILEGDFKYTGFLPKIGSFDIDKVGDEVGIFGFPHCVEGRRVFTFQKLKLVQRYYWKRIV